MVDLPRDTADLASALRALSCDGLLALADIRWLAAAQGVSLREVELAALEVGLVPARYQRSIGTVGLEGQARLLRSAVAVVGCGGLGGWAIEGLARMGLGRLVLIDSDAFEENNLNRQLGCTESSLGRPKAQVLAERVATVNAAVAVCAHVVRLTADNAKELLGGADVVVDALDTLPARLMLEAAAEQLGVPLVHGAIAGWSGQVMTVFPGDAGLRALYGDRGLPARGVETQLGNPSATPMMVAAWQVQEVVKYLSGCGELLRHRLLVLDAEFADVHHIQLGGSPDE